MENARRIRLEIFRSLRSRFNIGEFEMGSSAASLVLRLSSHQSLGNFDFSRRSVTTRSPGNEVDFHKIDPNLSRFDMVMPQGFRSKFDPQIPEQAPESMPFVEQPTIESRALTKELSPPRAADLDLDPEEYLIESATQIGKGLISPVTSLFESPRNFLIGTGILAGLGVASVVTSGAITPWMLGMGACLGLYQGYQFIRDFSHSPTRVERAKSMIHLGEAIITLGITAWVGFGYFGSQAATDLTRSTVTQSASVAGSESEMSAATGGTLAVKSEMAARAATKSGASNAAMKGGFLESFKVLGRRIGVFDRPDHKVIQEIGEQIVHKKLPEPKKNSPMNSWRQFFSRFL